VKSLLVAAQVPSSEALVDVLLAPLAPDLYLHQRTVLRLGTTRIALALDELAHRVLAVGSTVST